MAQGLPLLGHSGGGGGGPPPLAFLVGGGPFSLMNRLNLQGPTPNEHTIIVFRASSRRQQPPDCEKNIKLQASGFTPCSTGCSAEPSCRLPLVRSMKNKTFGKHNVCWLE